MLRFILKRRSDNSYGATSELLETLDLHVPELEAALTRGGMGEGGPGYDLTDLVGVEIRAGDERE